MPALIYCPLLTNMRIVRTNCKGRVGRERGIMRMAQKEKAYNQDDQERDRERQERRETRQKQR